MIVNRYVKILKGEYQNIIITQNKEKQKEDTIQDKLSKPYTISFSTSS